MNHATHSNLLQHFLSSSLMDASPYHLHESPVQYKLDQNEACFDWPQDIKNRLCAEFARTPWHLYPRPYDTALESLLAKHVSLPSECILLSPGSNYHVSLILSMCTQKNRHVVLASPSFPLYENHCRYAHIPWELWPLDDQHAYHLDALPKLSAGSVVIFASPNNPTGSVLPYKDLELLLHTYPDVLFVADEAYGAFTDQDYGPLILKHPHLILIRTFSKSWAMAGLRLGYTLAQAPWIHELRKMCVPFIISPFAALALRYALEHSHLQGYLKDQAHQTVLERTRLYLSLQNLNYVKVYPSEANFLLLEFSSTEVKASYVQQLASASILARDVGGSRGLSRCLRLSLATPMIHDLVLNVLRTPLSP